MATAPSIAPTPPPWSVIDFSFSNLNTDSDLVIDCNQRRFVVHLSAEKLSDSPQLEERYRFFLKVAENYELDDLTVEDFYDWAGEPFLPIFRELCSTDPVHPSTLQTYFFPETFEYNLCAISGKLVPVPQSDPHSKDLPEIFGAELSDRDCSDWQSFLPADVRICGDDSLESSSQIPKKVLLNEQTAAFLKLVRRGDKCRAIAELNRHRAIKTAALDDSIQISRLLGLVRDENGRVFGLLLTYVSCDHLTLSCAIEPETSLLLRKKWVSQIQSTIKQLHEAGIVWGDAKPDNILIDVNDDAWIIDFGGGYTEGWVTKAMAETKQGDLAALQKIVIYCQKFIGQCRIFNAEISTQ